MYPDDVKYTKEHEWVRADGDSYVVGITSYAAEQLGDVTYVELPAISDLLNKGDEAGTVESVKAASDIYAPIGGTVSDINVNLEDNPELVNGSPFQDGWFFKLENINEAELDKLMDLPAYKAYIEEQDH